MARQPQTQPPADEFYEPAPQAPAASQLAHAAEVRAHSVPVEESLSADVDMSPHAEPMSEREQRLADIERIRTMRQPMGAFTQKLALPKRAGYHRHWFNDSPGRIDLAKANGWAFVNDAEGKPIKRVVGSGRDNAAMYGYAMEIPDIFWLEDQSARHAIAQERLDSIKKRVAAAQPGESHASDAGKFYSPTESPVTIERR